MTNKGVENIIIGAAFGLALALFVWMVAWNADKQLGIVYALWPDQECRHVEPARFSCDNLPDRFEIVWVSREWRP